jgi:hypothetical protein
MRTFSGGAPISPKRFDQGQNARASRPTKARARCHWITYLRCSKAIHVVFASISAMRLQRDGGCLPQQARNFARVDETRIVGIWISGSRRKSRSAPPSPRRRLVPRRARGHKQSPEMCTIARPRPSHPRQSSWPRPGYWRSHRGAARTYCTGHGAGTPSAAAACSGQYGSRSSSRASMTRSAWPLRTI